jgi:hypothetical protein
MALLATVSIATCGGCSDSKKPAEAGMPKPGFDVESPVPGSPGGKRISETEDRIVRFEKRRESIQRLLDKALADKDDLVSKLRESGVVKSSDLKGKPEAQRYATSLTKLTREIDGLRGELARIDDTIQQAKSLVRRLQREEAGITEEEFAKLSEEFRAAEERTGDGASPVPDPIGIEAVLDRELKGSKAGSTPSAKGSERLVGKWEIVKGTRTVRSGAVEFTKGGTALLSWESVIRNALGDSQRRATLKYTLTGNTLRLEEPGNSDYRQKCEIQVEVISDGEMIFVNQKNSLSFDWLDGRLKRVK